MRVKVDRLGSWSDLGAGFLGCGDQAVCDPELQAPLAAMLERQPGFRVTVSTTPFGEAGGTAKRLQPDVTIVADVAGDPVAIVEELDEAVPGLPIIVSLRP